MITNDKDRALTLRGLQQLGADKGKKKSQPYVIQFKDFTQTGQSEVIAVCYGSQRRAGVWIFPVFKFRTKKIKQKVGK